MKYKVLTINPGSTSTKVSLFEDENCIYTETILHEATQLSKYKEAIEQLSFRKETIEKHFADKNVNLTGLSAVVGRGGSLYALESGTYIVDELILEHATKAANGVKHPAQLGAPLANYFAQKNGVPAYVVNPPDVDEYQDVARITGAKGIYRTSHLHALNLKETAIRHANSIFRKYEECNFIVCHIGGGISISAHRRGRMVDGYDGVGGEGPMAPTRCGGLPVIEVIKLLGEKAPGELKALLTKNGGFVNFFGTSDVRDITSRIAQSDKEASMVWNSFIYQIEKCIGAMAAVLHGDVDGILLGGGVVYSEDLVTQITEACSWIAPVTAYPGEFEMEAMAAGAIRILNGTEKVKTYSGKPVWEHFEWED